MQLDNRLIRGLLLLIITISIFALSVNDTVMSYIYPQMQIALVGVVKASFGAVSGYILGLILFPHKIFWDKVSIKYAGAIARLAIILMFIYMTVNYA